MDLDYHILTEALDTESDEEIFTEEPKELKVGDKVVVVDEESDLLGLSGIVEFIDGEDVTVLLNWDDEHQLRQTFNIDELSQEVDDDIEESLTEDFTKGIPQWVRDGLRTSVDKDIRDDLDLSGIDLANDKFVEINPKDVRLSDFKFWTREDNKLPVFLLLMPKQKKPIFFIPGHNEPDQKFKSAWGPSYKYLDNFDPRELKNYVLRAGYFMQDENTGDSPVAKKSRDRRTGKEIYQYYVDKDWIPTRDINLTSPSNRIDKSGYFNPSQGQLKFKLSNATVENYKKEFDSLRKLFDKLEKSVEDVSKKVEDKFEPSSPEAKEAEKLLTRAQNEITIYRDGMDTTERGISDAQTTSQKQKWQSNIDSIIIFGTDTYYELKQEISELNKKLDDAQ